MLVSIFANGLAGNAVRRYHASLTSYFILIPVYHVVWIVGQPFQAAIIQPQDLDQCTAFKTPITVMVDTIFMVVMPR